MSRSSCISKIMNSVCGFDEAVGRYISFPRSGCGILTGHRIGIACGGHVTTRGSRISTGGAMGGRRGLRWRCLGDFVWYGSRDHAAATGGLKATASRANGPLRPEGMGFLMGCTIDAANDGVSREDGAPPRPEGAWLPAVVTTRVKKPADTGGVRG